MKSSALYLVAVSFLSAPLFMGQAPASGTFGKGGGGFGCSKGPSAAVSTTESSVDGVDPNNQPVVENNPTTQSDACPAAPDPLNPSTDDTCQDRDFYASVKGRDWSEEITSYFGRPVDDACAGECGGDADHTPWTLSVRLSGTPFADGKSYSFSFMKDEWKPKVKYLQVTRNAADPDGCPADDNKACWKTCDGQCVDFNTVVKDNDTLKKDAETLLVSYANDVCKVGITVGDLSSDTLGDKIKTAADKATFRDILYCTEGVLLTGTQVLDWADTVSSLGLIKDETGTAYTQDQLYKCVKKSAFKKKSPDPETAPAPAAPPPAAAAPAAP